MLNITESGILPLFQWRLFTSLRTLCMSLLASFVATVPILVSSGVGREETGLKYNQIDIGSLLQLQQLGIYTRMRTWICIVGVALWHIMNANDFIACYKPFAIFALIRLSQK